jgi:hypothetical protein
MSVWDWILLWAVAAFAVSMVAVMAIGYAAWRRVKVWKRKLGLGDVDWEESEARGFDKVVKVTKRKIEDV